MSMVKVNSDNIWRLTSVHGTHYYVRCPSKSGAKIYLAQYLLDKGENFKNHAPFAADIILLEQIPEGCELIQAEFLSPDDPNNWKDGRV